MFGASAPIQGSAAGQTPGTGIAATTGDVLTHATLAIGVQDEAATAGSVGCLVIHGGVPSYGESSETPDPPSVIPGFRIGRLIAVVT